MLAQVDSSAILGIDAYTVNVEVDITSGIPYFAIVGLPDAAVNEARERVRSAIKNTGLDFPMRRIAINLAPADIKKQGPSFDLPIGVGILAATGQVPDKGLKEWLFVGELALDGGVRPVSGILPIAIQARKEGRKKLVVPAENAQEAAIVGDVCVYPVRTLADVVQLLCEGDSLAPVTADPLALLERESFLTDIDFSVVTKGYITPLVSALVCRQTARSRIAAGRPTRRRMYPHPGHAARCSGGSCPRFARRRRVSSAPRHSGRSKGCNP